MQVKMKLSSCQTLSSALKNVKKFPQSGNMILRGLAILPNHSFGFKMFLFSFQTCMENGYEILWKGSTGQSSAFQILDYNTHHHLALAMLALGIEAGVCRVEIWGF